MFRWLRRRRLQSVPFPRAWTEILRRNVPYYRRLPSYLQQKLHDWIQILVAEKHWEGCGGLSLEEEHCVTIAGHAGRLALGFEQEYFAEVASILVYPSAYKARAQQVIGPGVVIEGPAGRIGEAWYRGPIVLSWSDVQQQADGSQPGRNVVLHEFAHQLDMRNGRVADGVPVLETLTQLERWKAVTNRDYERLCALYDTGQRNVLDCYAATSPAEFFAVATEAFFESPAEMASAWPEYYRLLAQFYRQRPN